MLIIIQTINEMISIP